MKILPESFLIVLPEFACVETGEGINLFVDVGRMTKKHGNINKYAVVFWSLCSSLKMRAVTTVPRFRVTVICILSALFTGCRSSDRHLSLCLASVIDKRRYFKVNCSHLISDGVIANCKLTVRICHSAYMSWSTDSLRLFYSLSISERQLQLTIFSVEGPKVSRSNAKLIMLWIAGIQGVYFRTSLLLTL